MPTLVLPQRGVFRYQVAGLSTVADPNTALLFHPDQPYRITHPSDAGDECLALSFDQDTLDDVLGTAGEATRVWTLSGPAQRVLHARALQSLAAHDVLEREESAFAALSFLAPVSTTNRRAHDTARIEAIRERLAADVSANPSLASIARDVGLSPFHLARRFREHTGSSIHQYLLALRLATAHTRMRGGAGNLTQLAVDLGFSSLAHFSTTFRRAYGTPPSRALLSGASSSRAMTRGASIIRGDARQTAVNQAAMEVRQAGFERPAGAALPTGTVTFLFSDVEGSTERWERHRSAMEEAMRRHDQVLREAAAAHGGHVFKTMGDAFCLAFARPEDAAAAALTAQRALLSEDFSAVDGVAVRMALHTGTADERDGDYFGPSVNRVARLMAIGHGGQVLLSGVSADLVLGKLPSQATLSDRGSHRLKDLSSPEQVYQLLAPDLPRDFPPLRSLAALPNNLPLQLTSFVGREAEVEEISSLLEQHRLVTIAGSGGVGKSRVSLQVGANLLDGAANGVWFVELAPLGDGALIPLAIAKALGAALNASGDPVDAVVSLLQPQRLLLILDNCEHVVDDAARVADAILRGCPHVSILASSRQGLGISGEATYRMPSLSVPTDGELSKLTAEDALRFGAVALFAERARAADGRFAVTDDNAPVIGEIVRRLDGIALAIELAAPRVKMLTPQQLRGRLDERFRILTGGSRTALPRQQTLRALIDWSYDLLSHAERALLRRVGVFVGGWTLEAAEAVCTDEAVDALDLFDLMASLVEKSLVVADFAGTTARYRLLESTRAYARDKLKETAELPALERRHAEWIAGVADASLGRSVTENSSVWLPELGAELDNARAAFAWGEANGVDADLVGRIVIGFMVILRNGFRAEGRRWVETVLARDPPPSRLIQGRLLNALASVTIGAQAHRAAEAALPILEEEGTPNEGLWAMANLAYFSSHAGDDATVDLLAAEVKRRARSGTLAKSRSASRALARVAAALGNRANDSPESAARIEEAKSLFSEAVAMADAQSEEREAITIRINFAELEFATSGPQKATAVARDALERARRLPLLFDLANEGYLALNLTSYLLASAEVDLDATYELVRHGFTIAQRLQEDVLVTGVLQNLALIASLRGDPETGAVLLGHVQARYLAAEAHPEPTEARVQLILEESLRKQLDAGRLESLRAQGAELTEEQAIERARQI